MSTMAVVSVYTQDISVKLGPAPTSFNVNICGFMSKMIWYVGGEMSHLTFLFIFVSSYRVQKLLSNDTKYRLPFSASLGVLDSIILPVRL